LVYYCASETQFAMRSLQRNKKASTLGPELAKHCTLTLDSEL
jgi:hypothetical protein